MRQVIVTGAARGLGLEIAKKHLELGDTVWACVRKENGAIRSMKETYGDRVRMLLCDLGDGGQVKKAWEAMAAENRYVDLV